MTKDYDTIKLEEGKSCKCMGNGISLEGSSSNRCWLSCEFGLISVLQLMGVTLYPKNDMEIHTAASNLVPLQFYMDLWIDIVLVMAPMWVFTMPTTCEPTYELLLSPWWLHYCQAIGDSTQDSYIIKDRYDKDHEVPQEWQGERIPIRPKVVINPEVEKVELEDTIVEELKLEEEVSFEDMARQIT
ncbi:hypothetical protein L873DRAFT_1920875 [Choiromyces venosus 120613-1]|uniref:Uncharacterized protein n=1 Tax=Choiromyces venosus 120613-1 TaxID=1336337 RepID=A0A3N4JIU4_9PEZI|nr:hypothetical protein L873DRAFT_1920875 [Choiromyces venosus 120613-1]